MALITHPDVDVVIFTGGTETGMGMLSAVLDLYLSAETGGKNATIVTAMSDRDQAIKNVPHSAFSNCGQKCSATSLLILEKEDSGDLNFKRQLVDAAESLTVGSAWDFQNNIGPLIHPPSGALKRGIEQLEPDESWALKPRNLDDNPNMWTPGIKWDVKAGSPNDVSQFVTFEESGYPRMGVIKRDHGLLRLAQEWQRKADWGAFPPESTADILKTVRAIKSYLYHFEREFSLENDYIDGVGQDNILRYRPTGRVMVRIQSEDSLFDVLARIAAVRISGCDLLISIHPDMRHPARAFLASTDGQNLIGNSVIERQTDQDLIRLLPDIQRIRYADARRVTAEVFGAAAEIGFYVARAPVLMEGRIERLHYFINQSICDAYHRYGNLGERSLI
jgi:delta 1-pyrroline-5-carboxylate dehydrogenase